MSSKLNANAMYFFYPEATETRCTAALPLEINPSRWRGGVKTCS